MSNVSELQKKADGLRKCVVEMIGPDKTGHLGGSCSLAEIVAVLYYEKMKHDPKNPALKDRDRLILSKGHAAIIQYAALADCGYFAKDKLNTLKQLGSDLQGHPDMRKVPGIEGNTGSLGQGVSIAGGMAAGLKLDKIDAKVYVVVGDGELAEGQIWEGLMAAANFKLDNLRVILDKNGIQATGPTKDRFVIDQLDEKFKAFGFEVFNIDGHSIPEVLDVFEKADKVKDKPVAIIANTVKGKGIPFAEHNAAFHNGTMTQDQYNEALAILNEKIG